MKLIITYSLMILFLSVSSLHALSIEGLLKENVSNASTVIKSRVILSKKELLLVKKRAKVALKTRLYRLYEVKNKNKLLGYGILITRKVRTKKATVLYYLNKEGDLEFTEIVAFFEVPEYLPNQKWLSQFQHVEKVEALKLGRTIPTISGATLSARNVTQGARVAEAIYNIALQ